MVFPLLEIVDENELGLNEAVRNANQPNEAIWIITKYKLLKKRKQEYDQNNGQAERITLKGYRSEELFNHAGLSMFNIYYKISLHMFLTKRILHFDQVISKVT